MSGATSNITLSLDVGKEKNVIWLDTYFYAFIPHSIANLNCNVVVKCEPVRPLYVDISLEFQFVRISELEFRVTCLRTPVGVLAPFGYTLQFHCSINLFDDDPKVFEMQAYQFVVFERFLLSPFYRQILTETDLNKQFEMKVLIKMIEYNCSNTNMYLNQEEEFRQIKEKFFNKESVLKDLCYILHIPRVKDIFTGRQNNDFAKLKCTYIQRTTTFSKQIADYLKAKEACIPAPLTDLGLILNYILHGELGSISDKDLFKVYLEGHRMGLNFVVDLSRDCILGRIGNQNYVIDILRTADRVNDKVLFDKAAEIFHSWNQDLRNSETWVELLRNSNSQSRFVVHSLQRRMKRIESAGATHSGGTTESSPLKLTLLTMLSL